MCFLNLVTFIGRFIHERHAHFTLSIKIISLLKLLILYNTKANNAKTWIHFSKLVLYDCTAKNQLVGAST